MKYIDLYDPIDPAQETEPGHETRPDTGSKDQPVDIGEDASPPRRIPKEAREPWYERDNW